MSSGFCLPEKAITGKSKVDTDLMETGLFLKGKKEGDTKAADQVITENWSPTKKKLQELSELLSDRDVLLITQPGTSRNNQIPLALAKRLSEDYSVPFINGDSVFRGKHNEASKNIPAYRRLFAPREYDLIKPDSFLEAVKDRQVVIVEDILTTGGSLSRFQKTLNSLNVPVKGVVGFMGSSRLKIDAKTLKDLNSSLDNQKIGLKDRAILNDITRQEGGFLIRMANQVNSENKRLELSDKLNNLVEFERQQKEHFSRIALAHGVKTFPTCTSSLSNFDEKELKRQFSEKTLKTAQEKLIKDKRRFSFVEVAKGKKIIIEHPNEKARKEFIKRSTLEVKKIKNSDPTVFHNTLNNTVVKPGKDPERTVTVLKSAVKVFDKVNPEQHSFLLLSNTDFQKPLLLDVKNNSTRDALIQKIKEIPTDNLKVRRIPSYNPIALSLAHQNKIQSKNINKLLLDRVSGHKKTKAPKVSQVKKSVKRDKTPGKGKGFTR